MASLVGLTHVPLQSTSGEVQLVLEPALPFVEEVLDVPPAAVEPDAPVTLPPAPPRALESLLPPLPPPGAAVLPDVGLTPPPLDDGQSDVVLPPSAVVGADEPPLVVGEKVEPPADGTVSFVFAIPCPPFEATVFDVAVAPLPPTRGKVVRLLTAPPDTSVELSPFVGLVRPPPLELSVVGAPAELFGASSLNRA